MVYEVAVIGAGPAGCSAALFTAKAGKKTVIFDSNQSVTKRAWLENYYGVAEISGPEMLANGIAQAKKFGAELIETKVTAINKTTKASKLKQKKEKWKQKTLLWLQVSLLT